MNKKAICGILSAALLISACPVSAMAANLLQPETLNKSLDFRYETNDIQGDGWKWKAESQVLTLEDFRYVVPYDKLEESAAIYLPDDSTLKIKGKDNTLRTRSYHCDAIYCEGELTVTGDGELEILTSSLSASAFYLQDGRISFENKVEVTIKPESGYLIYVDNAKGRRPIISVQNDAKVIFNEKECKDRNIMITHKASVTPSENWLDYVEAEDPENDDYINLVSKSSVAKQEEPDKAPAETEDTSDLNVYQIAVGEKMITKNGVPSYVSDVAPYLKNGYTMLPLRALLEVSNPDQKVNWNNGTKSAHTFVNNKLVSIRPGESTYTKVTESIELRTPAETVNGRLFVSLRDWMNIMEMDVDQLDWDAATKTITMKY